MDYLNLAIKAHTRTKSQILAVSLLAVFFFSACSGISIEGAKALSVTGRNVAVQAQENVLVSEKEYLRARDSEALLHGFHGQTSQTRYQKNLEKLDKINQELAKRAVVFEKLADLYDAFGDLASIDAGGQTEAALGNLGGAIEDYAKIFKQTPPIFGDATAIITKIGGMVVVEIQKAKIKEASRQIRTRVEAFVKLLENPEVREQMVGFKSELMSEWKEALFLLWDHGVYDPKPLFDDIGAPAGLAAQKNAVDLIKPQGKSQKNAPNPETFENKIKRALKEVLDKRVSRQMDLIEKSYDVSLEALRRLIPEHEKLEKGAPLDLTRLRAIVAQLRSISTLLAKMKKDIATN